MQGPSGAFRHHAVTVGREVTRRQPLGEGLSDLVRIRNTLAEPREQQPRRRIVGIREVELASRRVPDDHRDAFHVPPDLGDLHELGCGYHVTPGPSASRW